jgi:hypothetical protein
MKKTKHRSKLLPFDAARYLTDDSAVAEYVNAVLETGDADLLLMASATWPGLAAWPRWPRTPASDGRASTRPWRRAPSRASTPCSRSLAPSA